MFSPKETSGDVFMGILISNTSIAIPIIVSIAAKLVVPSNIQIFFLLVIVSPH